MHYQLHQGCQDKIKTWCIGNLQAGEFQCYDERALASLSEAAAAIQQPEWGLEGPHDAGEYNSWPEVGSCFIPSTAGSVTLTAFKSTLDTVVSSDGSISATPVGVWRGPLILESTTAGQR